MEQIFIKNFAEKLIRNGFDIIKSYNNYHSNNDFFMFFKTIGSNGYIILPILCHNKNYIPINQNIENYLEKFRNNNHLSKIFLIQILISEIFTEDDICFLENEFVLNNKITKIIWGIDTKNKTFLINKSQPNKFLNIEKYLQECFSTNTQEKSINNFFEDYQSINSLIKSENIYITLSLIFINLIVYSIISLGINDINIAIIKYGISPYLIRQGEFYRLITFMFLHSGISHLISNSLSLYIFGTRIEKFLGKKAFILIYILGGIASGIFSFLFTKSYSIGASGAIFSLEGSILYFTIKEKRKLDGLDFYTMSIFSIVGIAMGFMDNTIDNAGHIGGFLIGIIICYIYYNKYFIKK